MPWRDINYQHLKNETDPENEKKISPTFRVLKVTIGLLLLVTALFFTVLSKLTLISMTSNLRSALIEEESSVAISLYWQLLFVMMVPQCITFLRTMVRGVYGKRTTTYPWPTVKAGLVGVISSIVEVGAMTCLVYLVLTLLPPFPAICSMNGIFMIQALIDCFYMDCCDTSRTSEEKIIRYINTFLENRCFRIFGSLVQICTILAASVYIGVITNGVNLMLPIALPLCLIAISAVWCTKLQEVGTAAKKMGITFKAEGCHKSAEKTTSRYRSNFINAAIRISLYPFVSYIIFRYALTHNTIDPWCLNNNCSIIDSFKSLGRDVGPFIVQILASLFGYIIIWISCTMGFNRWGMAIPLFLCTPVSVVLYQFVILHDPYHLFQKNSMDVTYFVGALWVGQMLVRGFSVWNDNTNSILANDTSMFIIPHYDGVLLEQQILLNKKFKDKRSKKSSGGGEENSVALVDNSEGREEEKEKKKVFVCSTMYKEERKEMEQLLSSIYKLACYSKHLKDKKIQAEVGINDYSFESHIFFDGGISEDHFNDYALQLVSLLDKSLGIDISQCDKYKMPYGCRLYWKVENVMPFYIHLKDNAKIKNKKRWSQVMYMNYVLKYRIPKQKWCGKNTFIITTDADIRFEPKSVLLLLDTLNADPKVGAVCARTHPQGSGLIYWYQAFEYAIGHWLQKAAEHILGCVLCCPGCFSGFRCSALESVLDEYSTEVTHSKPTEFLTKDMGEDRWLCTLLIKKGWRLEYCAVSENHTHCPEDFNAFYKQRRRWIPSTVANLYLLIRDNSKITKGNDSVSILFILYQGLLVFSTAISPATVILVIASSFASAYNASDAFIVALIVILVLFSVAYGLFCMYGNPQHQLDVAQIASVFVWILMVVVFAGNLINVVYDFLSFRDNCKSKYLCVVAANGTLSFPLTPSTVYLFLFTLVFIITGFLHFNEFRSLFHGVWYFLALPSAYLILIIYSAANLDDQSWGTREESSGGQGSGPETFKKSLYQCVNMIVKWWTCKAQERKEKATSTDTKIEAKPHAICLVDQYAMIETNFQLSDEVKCWLRDMGCQEYEEMFRKHGYTKLSFVAGMTAEDLNSIGIKHPERILHLEKAAKDLHGTNKTDVTIWLEGLELPDYNEHFKAAGFKTTVDLIGLTEEGLHRMGIHTGEHLQILLEAINNIKKDVRFWLERIKLPQYKECFEAAGIKTTDDLVGLTEKDLQHMGINMEAHLQILMEGIIIWLLRLKLPVYSELFEAAGYKTTDDIVGLTKEDLQRMGIHRRAHLQILIEAINRINKDVRFWLERIKLPQYKKFFKAAGIKTTDDLIGLTEEDLKSMGIWQEEHCKILMQGIDHITGVTIWLEGLELPEYQEHFEAAGCKTTVDLIGLTEESLQRMGIHKRAHLKRLMEGISKIRINVSIWLQRHKLEEHNKCFEDAGFKTTDDLIGLTDEDLQHMGIQQEAHRKTLMEAIINTNPKIDVNLWLKGLELQGYQELFEAAGYKTTVDLIGLTEEDLQSIGIQIEEDLKILIWAINKINMDLRDWLQVLKLQQYKECFEAAGFKTTNDLIGLTEEDLQRMGIQKEHCKTLIKRISHKMDIILWLKGLELQGYNEHFETARCKTMVDLIGLTEKDLQCMGIHMEAHLKKLIKGIKTINMDVRFWLQRLTLPVYNEHFEAAGYKTTDDLVGLTKEDLQRMGIHMEAHLQILLAAINKMDHKMDVHVRIWLKGLELPVYKELFEAAEYKTIDDLVGLTEEDLQSMGINNRVHLKRLNEGINRIHTERRKDVIQWLHSNGCIQYAHNFEEEGYFNLHFIAGLKSEDFEAIGIAEKRLRQRLEKAAKSLPALEIPKGIPDNVRKWLKGLELENYTKLFAAAGCQTSGDLESLKCFEAEDFKKIGVLKKAHQHRLVQGIGKLMHPTEAEHKVQETKTTLEKVIPSIRSRDYVFWKCMLEVGKPLRPINKSDETLKEALKYLRNVIMAVLLIVNIMWIVLLYAVEFPELQQYNIPSKLFEFLFLAVYAVTIIMQFGAMIFHRGVTLVHYLARVETNGGKQRNSMPFHSTHSQL